MEKEKDAFLSHTIQGSGDGDVDGQNVIYSTTSTIEDEESSFLSEQKQNNLVDHENHFTDQIKKNEEKTQSNCPISYFITLCLVFSLALFGTWMWKPSTDCNPEIKDVEFKNNFLLSSGVSSISSASTFNFSSTDTFLDLTTSTTLESQTTQTTSTVSSINFCLWKGITTRDKTCGSKHLFAETKDLLDDCADECAASKECMYFFFNDVNWCILYPICENFRTLVRDGDTYVFNTECRATPPEILDLSAKSKSYISAVLKEGDIQYCHTECCQRKATVMGQRFIQFQKKINDVNHRSFKIKLFGDSVSRMANFGPIRTFHKLMEKEYPQHEFNLLLDGSAGGSDLATVFDAGAKSEPQDLDLIWIQYWCLNKFKVPWQEALILLRDLPSKPFIVIMKHCLPLSGKLEFTEDETYRFDGNFQANKGKKYDKTLQMELDFLQRYEIFTIRMCSIFDETVLKKSCPGETFFVDKEEYIEKIPWTKPGQTKKNNLHYSGEAMRWQGRLAYDILTRPIEKDEPNFEVANHVDYVPANSIQNLLESSFYFTTRSDTLHPLNGSNWQLYTGGGRNGQKSWYESLNVGEILLIEKTPISSQIEIEFYTHHDLPMGKVDVYVDGKLEKTLDGCCRNDCVTTPGQGIYKTELIAENLEKKEHTIKIINAKRDDVTVCSKLGNKFNIVSIGGLINVK